MGEARPTWRLSDAARRCAAGGVAARSSVKSFLADARGATAIEYALLAAILGLGIISAAGALSTQIYTVLQDLATAMATAAGGG